jgi:transposase-like protein
MIAERDLCREARRILRKLTAADTALVRTENGKYLLHRGARPERSRHGLCGAEYVAGFRTRDWIKPRGTEPESFTLSEVGAAWLKRAEADGDPYAAQHQMRRQQTIIDPDGIERTATVNAAESPLARLFALKLIDAAQFAAGERLRRDYTIAQLAPRLGVDLSAQLSFGRRGARREHLMADTVLAAKQRFAAAMKAAGPGLNDVLYDVCCALLGLEDAERQFGWPSRSAKVVLGLALDRLALHYGLIVTAPARGRMRSWAME